MPTDLLNACRERWRDAPPLTDDELRERLSHHASDATHSRLVAEVLRLREENAEWRCVDQSWRMAWRNAL